MMYLYQIAFYGKISDTKEILLIIWFNLIAEVFSIGALTVELYLMFVTVRAATYFERRPLAPQLPRVLQDTNHFYLPFDCDQSKMVCANCQKSQKKTELATPGVKRKNDLYFGSPASHDKGKSSTASSASGIGKVGVCILISLRSLVDRFLHRANSSAEVQ